MIQNKKIEWLQEDVLQIEKKIITNNKTMEDLYHQFRKLEREWGIYENKYKNYLAKRDRFKNFLWWLYRKVTFRSTEVTKKELTKRIAKKMARVFCKGGCK